MSAFHHVYETIDKPTETGIQYFFMSKGIIDIIKAVEYTYVWDFDGGQVYNLGFGDYDPDTNSILDESVSNNGDPYKIFHTVLDTIPKFFKSHEEAMVIVWGSDSKQDFQDNCRLSCKKECRPAECKNAHRRINIYRNYVNKNYNILTKQYKFYGGAINIENQIFIESYVKGKYYSSVLLKKIISFTP